MKAFFLLCSELLLATCVSGALLTVTNTGDSGPGSLRQTVLNAAAGDIIQFQFPGPAVISLTSGPLVIDEDVAIVGLGARLLTIQRDANAASPFHVIEVPGGHMVAISGVTIANGVADEFAGGVLNSGILSLTACAVVGNLAPDFGNLAGGICNFGTLTLVDCAIADNLTTYASGGIYTEQGTLTMTNCTISGNIVGGTQPAGGTGSGPAQNPGGGIFAFSGPVFLINVTISNNHSAAGGEGIFVAQAGVEIRNTLIAGNGSEDASGQLFSLGYNLIGNGDAAFIAPTIGDQIGSGSAPINPMLGPLQDNGGPTETQGLLLGSPAIDQGGPVSGLTTDQRGQPRPTDDSAVDPPFGGDNSDIGAYEAQPSQSLNISTRAGVLTGEDILDGGFIITGSEVKTILIRGLGPSLTQFMLGSVLADPVLELHDSLGLVAMNDNWRDSQQAEIEATGIPPTDPAEAAIVATLSPGSYTAILEGKNGGVGTGLVEVYDLDAGAKSKLANISTRGFVGTGDDVLIGGFITGGGGIPVRVIVRAIGPSLAASRITGPLQDPALEIHDQNGAMIGFNDNWKDTQQAEIEATTLAPADNRESAILLTLANAPYTAIVRGVDGTVGVALVEVYDLD